MIFLMFFTKTIFFKTRAFEWYWIYEDIFFSEKIRLDVSCFQNLFRVAGQYLTESNTRPYSPFRRHKSPAAETEFRSSAFRYSSARLADIIFSRSQTTVQPGWGYVFSRTNLLAGQRLSDWQVNKTSNVFGMEENTVWRWKNVRLAGKRNR